MRAFLFAASLFLCLTTMPQARADADPTFARANADYASGKFKNAIDGY